MESQETATSNFSDTSAVEYASSLQLTVYGPGPYGQVDGRAQVGTLPYQWFQNGNLVATGPNPLPYNIHTMVVF